MIHQSNKKKKESDHTPKEVWKALKELIAVQKNLAQKIDETRQNIDKVSKQTQQNIDKVSGEIDKVSKETRQNIDKVSKETGKANKETRQNIDKVSKEIDRVSKETQQNIDKVTRQTANNINKSRGDWDNRWGGFVETLIADNVERLFEDYGIIKGEVETVNKRIYRSIDGIAQFEFDSITINGDKVIITEAKNKMTKPKINDFVKKVQKFLSIKDNEFSNKKVYIAIGYLKADNEKLLIKYAEGQGLFVIKAVGDSAKLVNSPQTFKPKQLNLNV